MDKQTIAVTCKALAENSLNVRQAAESIYIHRNTMVIRAQKIKEITGLDPLKFYDLCELLKGEA